MARPASAIPIFAGRAFVWRNSESIFMVAKVEKPGGCCEYEGGWGEGECTDRSGKANFWVRGNELLAGNES